MKKAFFISFLLHSFLVGSSFAFFNIMDSKNENNKIVLSMSINYDNSGSGLVAKGIETANENINSKETIQRNILEKKESKKHVKESNNNKKISKKEANNRKKEINNSNKKEDNHLKETKEVAMIEKTSVVAKGKQLGTGAGSGLNDGAKKSFGGVDGVYSLKEVDNIPKSIKSVRPKYPEYAKKMRIEGSVTVSFILDEKGNIRDVKIIKANPQNIFENSAITAVKNWKFLPATKNGEPVKVGMIVPINFKLDN